MSKIEYNSESREWYFASGLILTVTLLCYSFLNWYVLADQAEILPTIANATNLISTILKLSVSVSFTHSKEPKSKPLKLMDFKQL